MPTQRSLQFTEAMDQQVEALGKFGTRTDIVRIALDRLYREEIVAMSSDTKLADVFDCLRAAASAALEGDKEYLAGVWDANIGLADENGNPLSEEKEHEAARAAVHEAKQTLARAQKYAGEGYRYEETERRRRGIDIKVPGHALYWRRVFAGYLAFDECYRIGYVWKE